MFADASDRFGHRGHMLPLAGQLAKGRRSLRPNGPGVAAPADWLFRGDDERVMRLAAVGDLDGDARAGRPQALGRVLDAGIVDVRTAVEREDLRVGQAFRGIAERGDLVVAMRDDTPIEEGHRLTLTDAL